MPNTPVRAAAEGMPGISTMLASATREAKAKLRAVELLAHTLSERMQGIHGYDCRVHIDHGSGFVMVVVDEKKSAKPRRGGELA